MKRTLLFFLLLTIACLSTAQSLQFEWAKSLGAHLEEYGNAITTDASGNVYTTGFFQGALDFDPGPGTAILSSAGQEDVFISKLDHSGNFLWAKQLGGRLYDAAAAIAVDASGNVYTTGAFQDTADFDPGTGVYNLISVASSSQVFISKLDSAGNFLWAKQLSGYGWNKGTGIALDASGNVYTTGNFKYTSDFDPGPSSDSLTSETGSDEDIFILKLDPSGNFIWAKQFTGYSSDESTGISIDALGNILTTGEISSTDIDFDPGPGVFNIPLVAGYSLFVSKLNSSGGFIWARVLGGGGSSAAIVTDDSANVYTTGYYLWSGDFDPGPDTFLLTSAWGPDVFISKLNASGNFVWAKSLGGGTFDAGTSIAVDAYGNVYTTGYFEGTADFDPGAGAIYFSPSGGKDIFISELDRFGNYIWAGQLGGSLDDAPGSISVDASGNVYTTGYFAGTADFDPYPATVSNLFCAGGNTDVFVQKMRTSSVGVNEQNDTNSFSLYPNPSTGIINLTFNKPVENANVKIINIVGQIVSEEKKVFGNSFSVDVSGMVKGIYFAVVKDREKLWRIKFVKE